MILKLSGHIGSTASALVDGQLTPEDEERAWTHVMVCAGCRRLVEREGWVKRQLAGLSDPSGRATATPNGLLGSLYDTDAWADVDAIERRSHRRRAALAVVGAGSVGAAVLGLVTLTTVPVSRGETPALATTATARADVGATRRARGGLFGVPGLGSGLVPALDPEPAPGPAADVSPGAGSAIVAGASNQALVGATTGATTAGTAGVVTPRARR